MGAQRPPGFHPTQNPLHLGSPVVPYFHSHRRPARRSAALLIISWRGAVSATESARTSPEAAAAAAIEHIAERLKAAHAAVSQIIIGQRNVIEESLISLLAGGHVLLVGVPG